MSRELGRESVDRPATQVRWYHPHTPGVMLRQKNGIDYAAIPAAVTNKQP
jgi:hypothetical protein